MSEIIEMPLFWTEKLAKLEVGQSELIGETENRSTPNMAANRISKETGKVFSIRKIKETGETRIWRIK